MEALDKGMDKSSIMKEFDGLKYNLEDWRLDILSKQVNNQVKGLLG